MTTCPWCGTNYPAFQTNCDNCGGALPLPGMSPSTQLEEQLQIPPPAPRQMPRNFIWRLLFTDGWTIMALVFTVIGAVFAVSGVALTISIVALLVGLPFAGIGALFLIIGVPILVWRYQEAQDTMEVLRFGYPVIGQITSVHQNYNIRVNGRYPWSIVYQFELLGQAHDGKVTTLSQPDLSQQPGKPVYVLYLQGDPERNTIYPHPYGYYGS